MKYLIFVYAFALVAYAAADSDWEPKTGEQIKAFRDECIAENSVPAEEVEAMDKGEYNDVEAVRKFVLCITKKIGIFCGRDGYNVERVIKQFKGEGAEATEIAEKCADKNEQKDSVDVWAYRGHMCMWNSKLGDHIRELKKKRAEASA